MSTITQYSPIARILHWLIAGLIVSQYVLAELAEEAEHSDDVFAEFALMSSHKSIGMTILMLAVLRLLWRLFNTPPALPATIPSWQQRAALIAHGSMYVLIFAIPVSGWLMSSASDHSVNWFKLFMFPDMVLPSENLADIFHEVHEVLGKLLFVIAVVHIAAALKHHFKDKDDVLARMASLGGWLLLVATIAVVLGTLGRVSPAPEAAPAPVPAKERTEPVNAIQIPAESSNEETSAPVVLQQDIAVVPLVEETTPDLQDFVEKNDQNVKGTIEDKQVVTALPQWEIDYDDSYIKFSGDQSGTPFTAEWQRWNAKMRFDTEHLRLSEFDVAIDTRSVLSDDSERDAYIVGRDFFDAHNFSEARFLANQFSLTPGGKINARGSLTMKGLTNSALLSFSVKQVDRRVILSGTSVLDRLDWNIGVGDWADTSWVGKDVAVEVRVVATI